MNSKQFNDLVGIYGEGKLLRDVYSEVSGLGVKDAIRAIEGETFYNREVVRRLLKRFPEGMTRAELKEEATGYTEGVLEELRAVESTGYNESEVQDFISLIHNHYGAIILYNPSLVEVIHYVTSEDRYQNRRQFALNQKFAQIRGQGSRHIKDRIEKEATKLIRENESFNALVNTATIHTYEDFFDDIEAELDTEWEKYGELTLGLVPEMYDKEAYIRYLEILEERTYTKGKDEVLKKLRGMYPDKFKDVGDDWYLELEDYYLTWRDSFRVIEKGLTLEGYPEELAEINSDSKDQILKWFDYHNVHSIFR